MNILIIYIPVSKRTLVANGVWMHLLPLNIIKWWAIKNGQSTLLLNLSYVLSLTHPSIWTQFEQDLSRLLDVKRIDQLPLTIIRNRQEIHHSNLILITPQLWHTFWKANIFSSSAMIISKDYFMQMIYLDSSRLKAVYNYQNWDYSKEFAFTSVIPFKTGEWWDSQLMICLSSLHQQVQHYDAPFDREYGI